MSAGGLLKISKKLDYVLSFKRWYTQKNLLTLKERGFFQDMFPDTAE